MCGIVPYKAVDFAVFDVLKRVCRRNKIGVDDKGRVKLSRKAAMEERKAEFSDDEEGGSPDAGDDSEE